MMSSTALTLTSGGEEIRAERFGALGTAARPGVLLLHGADGLGSGRYRMAAGLVAAAGYHVFLLHYLGRTGEVRAGYSTIGQRFPLWAQTVRDGLSFVSGQPGVDADRLAILGISLGAALGMAVAAGEGRVKALVDYFGFVPKGLESRPGRLPPTLILHGARDAIVPAANAYELQGILQRQGVPYDMEVYPDQGHGFSTTVQIDAGQRTAGFLARHLGAQAAQSAAPDRGRAASS